MQKALDSLLQLYLRKETLGVKLKAQDLIEPQIQDEDEFLRALHQCMEEKGVMKEVQGFLRQKLVNALKGVWPDLVSNRCEGDLGRVAMTLIEDFVCCHKLLFTYSVLATELDEGFTFKGNFGKMLFGNAETILADMGIKKGSNLSQAILTTYSDQENWSLLECIISSTGWVHPGEEQNKIKTAVKIMTENEMKLSLPIDEKLRQINEKYNNKNLKFNEGYTSIEDKLRILTEAMELDKEAQIEIRMEKFHKEESAKIQDEVETRLKFQILQKEKELLQTFEDKITHMKRCLKREKQMWAFERNQKEKELAETRRELVKALAIAKTANTDIQGDEKQRTPLKQSMPETPGEGRIERKTSDIVSAIMTKKELERQYLYQEATMRNAMEKLKAENELLKKQNEHPQQIPVIEGFATRTRAFPNLQHFGMPLPQNNDLSDTIAFMQYAIESQAEEIQKLRQMKNPDIPKVEVHAKNKKLTGDEMTTSIQYTDSDLEKFLQDSKRRFAEIEREAKTVERSISAIQVKKKNSNEMQFQTGAHASKDSLSSQNQPLFTKFEYFPKYLKSDLQKSPLPKPYQPVLGSAPALIPKPALVQNFGPANVSIPRKSSHFFDIFTKTIGVSNYKHETVPETEIQLKTSSNGNGIDSRNIPEMLEISPIKSKPINSVTKAGIGSPEKIVDQTKEIEHLNSVSSIPPENDVRIHQEKANTSGALVKDRLSASDKSELEADLSFESKPGTSNNTSAIRPPNSGQKEQMPTWGEILSGGRNKSIPDRETIDDIGPETGGSNEAEEFLML